MPELLRQLFSSDGFMPHGHCYMWNPGLVWLHVVSDGLTALAYTSIPFTLVYLARRRKDVPFNWMFFCFGTFIIACGATHVMDIWTLWTPTYWLSGVIKAITAAASVLTAILLVRLVPRVLAIPTAQELSKAHENLRKAHDLLEARVRDRTAELHQRNEELAREIVERKRVEAALRKSEGRFRRLADAGIIGVVTADLAGNVLDANDTFLAMVGYPRSEVVSRPGLLRDLTPPAWHSADARATKQLQDAGIASAREKEYFRKDGSRIPVMVGGAMVESDAGECIAFILDLTELRGAQATIQEQRRKEEELRRAKETAEAASRELEAFSYSVAHDLRAPLRAINGYSAALVEDLGPQLQPEAREYLRSIEAGASRMGQLIDALLSLSRVSRAELIRENANLSDLASAVVQQLRATDPDRTVEFVLQQDLLATGDHRLLRALLDNLLGNAWKFTSRVDAARIEFGKAKVDGTWVYFVRDNGVGFDMAYGEKLFAPFQRLHTASEFAGNGIGLATVQRIVSRHGGRIWAQGAVDGGATFHFTLQDPQRASP